MEWVFESNPLISFNSHDALNILQKNGGGVFPVIHGEYGEDGQLQFLLEQAGIPFVGSSSQTMKLTLDKSSSSALFREHGLSVPQEILVRNLEDIA
jgi:D-alanine-D-alanine ligase-like ATP-grasp enzyme